MIQPRGIQNSSLWLLCEPTAEDHNNNAALSGVAGYHFDKMLRESGLQIQPYCVSINMAQPHERDQLLQQLRFHKPPIILLMGAVIAAWMCPDVKAKKKPFEVSLDKQAGSLLISPLLQYPHYCVPLWEVNRIYMDWSYRDIYINLDLGHAKDELEFWQQNKRLNPLPQYNFLVEPLFNELQDFLLNEALRAKKISNDIETIGHTLRKKQGRFFGHPGYFYVIGMATSNNRACSFSLWDYSTDQLITIWRLVDSIINSIPIIGQNFFRFDLNWYEALGFTVNINNINDTYVRQHILWPELERSLQFMVKQYTRQPYFKDEGKTWTPKQKKQYMKYNCLDCCNTFAVWEAQENEFSERQYLR